MLYLGPGSECGFGAGLLFAWRGRIAFAFESVVRLIYEYVLGFVSWFHVLACPLSIVAASLSS